MSKKKNPYHGIAFKREAQSYFKQHNLCVKTFSIKNKILHEAIEAHKAGDPTLIEKLSLPRSSKTTKRMEDVSFYDSPQWKHLRYAALVKHGGACQCCGATRADGVKLHVDHIKPRSKYPELELALDNLQILCEPCNMGKRAWDETDWRGQPACRGTVIWTD